MSGFYLIGVVAVWLTLTVFIFRLCRHIFRNGKRSLVNTLTGITIIFWLGISFWYGGGIRFYYDWQVERLCSIDGGVKVYETVMLPIFEYESLENSNWVLRDKDRVTPTDSYYSESETHYFRKSFPQVARTVTRIFRRADGALLGEYIRYGRGGGDFPGPWYGSSFLCPDPTHSTGFETKIFIKGER